MSWIVAGILIGGALMVWLAISALRSMLSITYGNTRPSFFAERFDKREQHTSGTLPKVIPYSTPRVSLRGIFLELTKQEAKELLEILEPYQSKSGLLVRLVQSLIGYADLD